MTNEEHAKRFKEIMKTLNKSHCKCGRELEIGEMSWNSGEGDYGTPYSIINVICDKCSEEVIHFERWGGCDDINEALDILESDDN